MTQVIGSGQMGFKKKILNRALYKTEPYDLSYPWESWSEETWMNNTL